MSDETQAINFIPSETLCSEFPEFGKLLEIYGSSDSPLFTVQQVQDILGIDRIRLDAGDYDIGEDYIKMVCIAKDGRKREQNVLTEQGLYNVIFRSRTDLGKKFRRFVTIVLKELRTVGQVTLSDALEKLKVFEQKLEESQKQNAMLDQQLEEEHSRLLETERERDKYFSAKMSLMTVNEKLKSQVNRPTIFEGSYQLECLKEMALKKLYAYLSKPPKEVKMDDYDAEYEPAEDEVVYFQLSFAKRKTDSFRELYVKKCDFKTIQDKLYAFNFGVKIDNDTMHDKIYYGAMDDLQNALDEITYSQ